MKYKFLLVIILFIVAQLNSMQVDDLDGSISDSFKQPKSLVRIVAKFLAYTLIHAIQLESYGDKGASYENYLASCPLNTEAEHLVLGALVEHESRSLWRTMPFKIIQQNLGMHHWTIMVLENDQLLVFHNDQAPDYYSKIRIWDTKFEKWIDTDLGILEIRIHECLLSKDLKTLFLLCDDSFVLVYDLAELKELSRITSSPAAIKSFCLFNNDTWICCGLSDGSIVLFNKNTAEKIFSFQAASNYISSMDSVDDFIVTFELGQCITSWKLSYKTDARDITDIVIDEVDNFFMSPLNNCVRNLQFGLNGKTLLVNCYYPLKLINTEKVEIFTFPEFKSLKSHTFYPSYVGFKRSQDGKMLFAAEGKDTWVDHGWYKFKFIKILDAGSGEIIRRFDFDQDKRLLAADGSSLKWSHFAISPDNIFLILYSREGNIAKISLDLDHSLKNVLEKIKLKCPKKSKLESYCLIS